MSAFDPLSFRPSDLKKCLGDLKSSGSENTGLILKKLLYFILQGKDAVNEVLANDALDVLIELYTQSKEENDIKSKIACILILLCEKGNNSTAITDSLANILSLNSDFHVFIQSISGIRKIINVSSSPTIHSISIYSAAQLFSKMASILSTSSSSLSDSQKLLALDKLMEIVNSASLNESVNFSTWAQTNRTTVDDDHKELETSSVSLLSSFSAFSEALNKIALQKQRNMLNFSATHMLNLIKENSFFPCGILLPTEDKLKGNVPLPLKFMHTDKVISGIVLSSTKVTWSKDLLGTFFVDLEMNQDLHKVEVVAESSRNMASLWIGLCNKELTAKYIAGGGNYSADGSCFMESDALHCCGTQYSNAYFTKATKHTFGLEFDANKGVLFFFVDDSQIPYSVINVPKKSFFAVYGYFTSQIFELKSLQKLSTSTTTASLTCAQYSWK